MRTSYALTVLASVLLTVGCDAPEMKDESPAAKRELAAKVKAWGESVTVTQTATATNTVTRTQTSTNTSTGTSTITELGTQVTTGVASATATSVHTHVQTTTITTSNTATGTQTGTGTSTGTATQTATGTTTETSTSTTTTTALIPSTVTVTGTRTGAFTATHTTTVTSTNTTTWEAESLCSQGKCSASSNGWEVANDGIATYMQFNQSNSPAVGNYLEFTLPSLSAGTYEIKYAHKSNNNRGIAQASIDGVNVGSTCDQYSASSGYNVVCTVGTKALSAGIHTLRLTVAGKNPSTTSPCYSLTVDKIMVKMTSGTGTGTVTGTETYTHTATSTNIATNTQTLCAATTYQAESLSVNHQSGSLYLGFFLRPAWGLWDNNAYLYRNHNFTAGPTKITVVAGGPTSQGVYPHMVVSVGGVTVLSTYTTTTGLSSYPVTFTASGGTQEIRITFDNDINVGGEDRNLLVDYFTVECLPGFGTSTTTTTVTNTDTVPTTVTDTATVTVTATNTSTWTQTTTVTMTNTATGTQVQTDTLWTTFTNTGTLTNTSTVTTTNTNSTTSTLTATTTTTNTNIATLGDYGATCTDGSECLSGACSPTGHVCEVKNDTCVNATSSFEAESQARLVSAGAIDVVSDSSASSGKLVVASPPVDGYVEYQLAVPATGVYTVSVRHAVGPSRGRWKLMVGGRALGNETDSHATAEGYIQSELGKLDVMRTETKQVFRFVLSGKLDSVASPTLAIDRIDLRPIGCRYEAERANPQASTMDSQSNVAQDQASNGMVNQAILDAVDDSVRYTFRVETAAEYRVLLRYQTGPSQGIFRLKFDDTTDLGPSIDAYAVTPGYVTRFVGKVTLQPTTETSSHSVLLTVSGKNANSTGYGITADYIELRDTTASQAPTVTTTWQDSPIKIGASLDTASGTDHPSEVTLGTPVTFTIPARVPVRAGNAGNGEFQLKFRDSSGLMVTCIYRGAASVPHPTTYRERARGMEYRFQSCSDGHTKGQTATATWVAGQIVSGDPQSVGGKVSVATSLGGGCSDYLTADLSAAEIVYMKESFTWTESKGLAETDPDGHPAIWHGLIYIERKEQLAALDRLKIMWSAMPLSKRYVEKWKGRCGRVEHASDGMGVVVYSIFPARFFNIMRNFGIQAETAKVPPPFAFIMPTTPDEPGMSNADGSLAYSALGQAGYLAWLKSRPGQQPWFGGDLVDWAGGGISTAGEWISDSAKDSWNWIKGTGADYAETAIDYVGKGWDASLDWTANALDTVWEGAQQGLQELVLVFADKVMLRMDLRIINRDPTFPVDSDFTRAWGPADASGNRPRVFPTGASMRIRQWSAYILPTMDAADIGDDGHVELEAVKGDTEGRGGLCIELNTDYAMITSDLIPNEVCDLSSGAFGNFDADYTGQLVVNQADVFALTQIRDASEYARQVIGHDPHQIQVLTGWLANELTQAINGKSRAMALCLDFPSMGMTALMGIPIATTTGGALVGGVGGTVIPALGAPVGAAAGGAVGLTLGVIAYISAPLAEKDLWWPDDDSDFQDQTNSRGVITHEYGHFSMCSMLYEADGPPGLRGLLARVTEGDAATRDKEVSLMCEAFADAYALQVVGAANYVSEAPGMVQGSRMGWCTASPCMDRNYAGVSDYRASTSNDPKWEFYDELARIQSLVQDAFDRSDSSARGTLAPGNGDIWMSDPATNRLVYATTGFIANDDEPVSLPGSGWTSWVRKWLDRGRTPSKANVIGGLLDAVGEATRADGQHYDWCDKCELLAPHYSATPASARMAIPTNVSRTMDIRVDRWLACATDTEMSDLLGPAPARYANLTSACQACPALNKSDGAGGCTPCAAGEVPRGRTCQGCAAGTIPGPDNECHSCAAREIVVNGACVPCGPGMTANVAKDACEDCVADSIVDWSVTNMCAPSNAPIIPTSGANDNCPDEFWLEVRHLGYLRSHQTTSVQFRAAPSSYDQIGWLECPSYSTGIELFLPATGGGWTGQGAISTPGLWTGTPCIPGEICLDPPHCAVSSSTTMNLASISVGVETVRAKAIAQCSSSQGTSQWTPTSTVEAVGACVPL